MISFLLCSSFSVRKFSNQCKKSVYNVLLFQVSIIHTFHYVLEKLYLYSNRQRSAYLKVPGLLHSRSAPLKVALLLALRNKRLRFFCLWAALGVYSHSIVAGGLLVISYTTLLMCFTSLTIRVETFSRISYGILAQSAVIKSVVVTARSAKV